MTTKGRIIARSSANPPPADDQAIDLIMSASIRRDARIQRLEAALDALLGAIHDRGRGLEEAGGIRKPPEGRGLGCGWVNLCCHRPCGRGFCPCGYCEVE